MPMLMDDKMVTELRALCVAWDDAATVIGNTHGDADPAVRALTMCAGELGDYLDRRSVRSVTLTESASE